MASLKTILLTSNRSCSHIPLKLNYHLVGTCRILQFTKGVKQYYSKDNGNSESNDTKIPEAPTTCCMSGCANCVWIAYAQELTKIFADSGEKSKEIILSKVTDENMKAFLRMELAIIKNKIKERGDE